MNGMYVTLFTKTSKNYLPFLKVTGTLSSKKVSANIRYNFKRTG